jgi:hypothetical protein
LPVLLVPSSGRSDGTTELGSYGPGWLLPAPAREEVCSPQRGCASCSDGENASRDLNPGGTACPPC